MRFRKFYPFLSLCALLLCMVSSVCAYADSSVTMSPEKMQELKKQFLSKIDKRLKEADQFLENQGIVDKKIKLRGLEDGELLIFNLTIPPKLLVEGLVFAEIYQNSVVLSLKDFISVLHFPITYDEESKTYAGWYIRENNTFSLDMNNRLVVVGDQEYTLSNFVQISEDDVLAPVEDFETWFDMDMQVDIGTQRIALDPDHALPATERFERRNKNYNRRKTEPPKFPRHDDEYALIATPVVDVTTRSGYKRDLGQKSQRTHALNVRTAGEFAKGVLNTNVSFNERDYLSSARFNYLQESAKPEILGPLKARRFEAGDIISTRLPLTGGASPEIGVRLTNTDPLTNSILPSTQIAGYFFPDWDIELYRDSTLLSFQQADEQGFYSFDNIPLLPDRNVFRVVAYGPQGEVREETLNVPYDRNRLASDGGVYDISVTLQERQLYEKLSSTDQDADTVHLTGFYEFPISEGSAVRLGARYRQEEGQNKLYTNAAVSTTIQQALVNVEVASDEKGEFATTASAASEIGEHRARADVSYATDHYNPGQNEAITQTFSNSFNVDGPFPMAIGDSPRYSANVRYDEDSEGTKNLGGFLSFNTQFERIGFSQIVNYSDSSSSGVEEAISTTTSLTGSYGRNIIRALANYEVKPEKKLEGLSAFWKRRFRDNLESQVQVSQLLEEDLTRYSAQFNWRPEYAVITPRVQYNSEGDIEATLSTRFSLAKIPQDGSLLVTKEPLTSSGSLSAFVYLDKNGDKEFNGNDEPIEGVRVHAPHNSGGGKTNENGVAYISQLRPNLVTDVYLDNASLPDPYWIAATDGVSVMPRTGDNIPLQFPVHISGEVEGVVYKKYNNEQSESLPNMIVSLYDMQGEIQSTTSTGPDGFYVFALIPPGTYFLMLSKRNLPKGFGRPLPKKITIGYDGTILYGQDIEVKEGTLDVEISLLSPEVADANVFLNFGAFNSRLMMAYIWKNLVRQHGYILGGSKLLATPNDSKARQNDGRHVLRASIEENTLSAGYKRCQVIVKSGNACAVEVMTSSL